MKTMTMEKLIKELEFTETIAVVTNNDGLQWIDVFPKFGKRYEKSDFMAPIYIDRHDDLIEKMHEIVVVRNLALLEYEENQFDNIDLGL